MMSSESVISRHYDAFLAFTNQDELEDFVMESKCLIGPFSFTIR